MGLDMYLNATKYVSSSNWKVDPNTTTIEFKTLLNFAGLDEDDLKFASFPHGVVSLGVGYWRKVNSIHQWFVDNCQNGEDDCRSAYVSREQLADLLGVVKEAIATQDSELLPPSEGFFFGSTDVDEYYWKDLEYTQEMLESLLANPNLVGWDFEYRSSW